MNDMAMKDLAMKDLATNPYDAVAYPGHAFSQTHPAHLATIAHIHGMTPAPTATMRVLELGCGSGGNLIPMALQCPGAQLVGIDLSGRAIAHAKAEAAELGLGNVSFEQRDIMAVTTGLGEFDYIIVHGVYSWVPQPVRERILALFGELLAPQGIAYVSYNALPGCRLRDLARDVMLFETREIDDPIEKVRVARAAIRRFAEATDAETFYGVALRERAKQIEDIPDNVLYHDDLNPGARAFALHEVLAAAEPHGLQFLSETSFPNNFGGARGPAQQVLNAIPVSEPLRQEQALDLLIGRCFRQTLLCRADIALHRGLAGFSFAPYHLAANVQEEVDRVDEKRPGAASFLFADGVRLAVDLPAAKAALRALGRTWPGNIHHDELVTLALQEAGPDHEHEIERLNEALTAIYRAGLIEVSLEPHRLATGISERPVASLLARRQALASHEVTDLRHRAVALDGVVVRKFVSLLDGTRTPAMLLDALNAFLAEAHASGHGGPALPKQATAAEVDMHLRDVARLALLAG
ncbi:methyltransferase domain-containing protein [Bosea sp. CCNWLW174]|uniref:methyltransferase domain-containing protein n=1 Tax=unclassified Bosea (in: a-proteobacteria) TaxID=2653178 RepID=UPI003014498D